MKKISRPKLRELLISESRLKLPYSIKDVDGKFTQVVDVEIAIGIVLRFAANHKHPKNNRKRSPYIK